MSAPWRDRYRCPSCRLLLFDLSVCLCRPQCLSDRVEISYNVSLQPHILYLYLSLCMRLGTGWLYTSCTTNRAKLRGVLSSRPVLYESLVRPFSPQGQATRREGAVLLSLRGLPAPTQHRLNQSLQHK